ncbi:hypothetical protein B0H14DRAFT_2605738 [Mycena olivaceomarginata]|nr:hypothetical protein B0H14DRAFT_2605738 [Mycena olivaceomarginata]
MNDQMWPHQIDFLSQERSPDPKSKKLKWRTRTLTDNNQSNANNVWGFGQVLSLLLLVVPLRDAWNAFRDVQEGRLGVQHQFQQMLQEELTTTPILDRLRVLINRDADPRKPIKGTKFPNSLRLVGYLGRKDLVEFFGSEHIPVEKRLTEDDPTGGYKTLLQAASANGQIAVVEQLLELRPEDVNIEGGHYGTAFCAACANGKIVVAKLLFQRGADVTLYSQTNVIRWLLDTPEMKIDKITTWDDLTALDVAVFGKQAEAEKLLREKGVIQQRPDADNRAFALVQQAPGADNRAFALVQQAAVSQTMFLPQARCTHDDDEELAIASNDVDTKCRNIRKSGGSR